MGRTFTAPRIGTALGPLLLVVCFVWLAGLTGPDAPSRWADGLWTLFGAAPLAAAWLGAAAGFGAAARRVLLPGAGAGVWLPLGIAVLLVLDAALGATGVLGAGGGAGAWVLTAIGIVLLVIEAVRNRAALARVRLRVPLLAWTAVPALAVLVLAACSAPGALWASEFGGYDALSYHLQLPKEWLELGRIAPLEHNVYSALPGYVEGAFHHLALLRGDAIAAAYAAQLLHAALAITAAVTVGLLAQRRAGSPAGIVAGVLTIGTPWIVVTGSLAYNDVVPVLALAAGWLVLEMDDAPPARRGAALGLLLAAAIGAKLTAVGFVAAPLVLLATLRVQRRHWVALGAGLAIAALIGLAPYLVRNAVTTGNPVFPFATGTLGRAHWSAEQSEIWTRAHHATGSLGDRAAAAWNEWLRYGIGPRPDPDEPWAPQWSVLPLLGIASALILILRDDRRRDGAACLAVLAVQLAFWLGFTHMKSRFMLPGAVPLVLAVAVAVAAALPSERAGWRGVLIGAVLLAWSMLPVAIFRREAGGRPAVSVGAIGVLTGDALTRAERDALAESVLSVWVNHALPPDARVLLIGDATPFYLRHPVTYCTTWDRGPVSHAMDAAGGPDGPWIDHLIDAGYTHLLIKPAMLARWHADGWGDPRFDPARIVEAADRRDVARGIYPDDTLVFILR